MPAQPGIARGTEESGRLLGHAVPSSARSILSYVIARAQGGQEGQNPVRGHPGGAREEEGGRPECGILDPSACRLLPKVDISQAAFSPSWRGQGLGAKLPEMKDFLGGPQSPSVHSRGDGSPERSS